MGWGSCSLSAAANGGEYDEGGLLLSTGVCAVADALKAALKIISWTAAFKNDPYKIERLSRVFACRKGRAT